MPADPREGCGVMSYQDGPCAEPKGHAGDHIAEEDHKANPRPDLNGDLFGDLIAALTGTENADAGR